MFLQWGASLCKQTPITATTVTYSNKTKCSNKTNRSMCSFRERQHKHQYQKQRDNVLKRYVFKSVCDPETSDPKQQELTWQVIQNQIALNTPPATILLRLYNVLPNMVQEMRTSGTGHRKDMQKRGACACAHINSASLVCCGYFPRKVLQIVKLLRGNDKCCVCFKCQKQNIPTCHPKI